MFKETANQVTISKEKQIDGCGDLSLIVIEGWGKGGEKESRYWDKDEEARRG